MSLTYNQFSSLNSNNPLNQYEKHSKHGANSQKDAEIQNKVSPDLLKDYYQNKKPKVLSEKEKALNASIDSIKVELEYIQSMLNEATITQLWINFRECENKKNGRIPKKEFKKGIELVFDEDVKYMSLPKKKRDLITDLLFERFNYIEKMRSIDIYDFLISMSILSRISNDEKTELILKLIDVDEDRCLSIGEVFKMILAIEKNFVKELNYLNFQSGVLYNEMAFQNAVRKFRLIIGSKHPVENMTQKYITQTLITYPEFLKIVKANEETYKNFLPHNQNIVDFLKTRFTEMKINVTPGNYKHLLNFLKEVHQDLRPKEEFRLYDCRIPGSIEISKMSPYGKIDEETESFSNLGLTNYVHL